MRKAVGTFALACAVAGTAHAEPGGVSGVSGVSVTQGALKLEARTVVFDGGAIDGDRAHRAQAGYGVTDWWRTEVILRASQPGGEGAELRSVGWENAVDFTATRDWPVHFGGLFEYRFGVDDVADSIELKLLAERRIQSLSLRFNLIGERAVGDDASDEWEHGYAARAMYALNEAVQVGVEGFGELDIDAHAWGPRAGVTFGPATVSAAYLASFGEDSDADSQLRFAVEFRP